VGRVRCHAVVGILAPCGATVHATFASTDVSGLAAVTSHAYGSGTGWYVATQPSPDALARIAGSIIEGLAIDPVVAGLPKGVEAARRGQHLFLHQSDGARGDDRPCDAQLRGQELHAYAALVLLGGRGPQHPRRPRSRGAHDVKFTEDSG